jgi:hypothetical protein
VRNFSPAPFFQQGGGFRTRRGLTVDEFFVRFW